MEVGLTASGEEGLVEGGGRYDRRIDGIKCDTTESVARSESTVHRHDRGWNGDRLGVFGECADINTYNAVGDGDAIIAVGGVDEGANDACAGLVGNKSSISRLYGR